MASDISTTLALIGGGNMGSAMLAGLLSGESPPYTPDRILVVEASPERAEYLTSTFGVATTTLDEAPQRAGTILIVVKPYHVAGVLAELSGNLTDEHLIISAAGAIGIAQIEESLGGKNPVVRCMPNTAASVGEGMIAISAGTHAQPADLDKVQSLMECVGHVVRVPESQLDAVTALSGSGPAYFFYLAEALIDAGVLLGLSRPLAVELVNQTAVGAGLMLREAGDEAVRLRAEVSSPGGMTIAAIRALESGAVRAAVMSAAEAARDRSVEQRSA